MIYKEADEKSISAELLPNTAIIEKNIVSKVLLCACM
jgi:hypothetical protein